MSTRLPVEEALRWPSTRISRVRVAEVDHFQVKTIERVCWLAA